MLCSDDLKNLGNFGKYTSQNRINCYGPKHGASYSPDSSGTMDLAKCFLACNEDSQCDGITVKWGDAGLVDCYLQGGIDPKKCEKTPKGTYSTFTKD